MRKTNLRIEDIATISKKCDICSEYVMVDQWGQSWEHCGRCGWMQSEQHFENPDYIGRPNLVSFAKAKTLFEKGSPIKPTLDEYIEAYKTWGEMELWHKGKVYVLSCPDEKVLFGESDKEVGQSYSNIEEFRERAHIDGRLLRNIWDEIEKPNWLSH